MAFASNFNHFTGVKKKNCTRRKTRAKKKNAHKNKYERFSTNKEVKL